MIGKTNKIPHSLITLSAVMIMSVALCFAVLKQERRREADLDVDGVSRDKAGVKISYKYDNKAGVIHCTNGLALQHEVGGLVLNSFEAIREEDNVEPDVPEDDEGENSENIELFCGCVEAAGAGDISPATESECASAGKDYECAEVLKEVPQRALKLQVLATSSELAEGRVLCSQIMEFRSVYKGAARE
ncbi:MAG: hypothetical protein LBG89_00615 [Rickettsiales bacterium]|jgi:hypothetical protein|nr:hypothetical protein [Rickettsiales bacterium]